MKATCGNEASGQLLEVFSHSIWLGKMVKRQRKMTFQLPSGTFRLDDFNMPSDSPADLELRASYFQDFLVERIKIGDHKWIESEKAGRDIGWEEALVGWVMHHRSAWKRSRTRRSEPAAY